MLIFSPKIESPQHLEELLVGRKDIVNSIEKSVIQATLHDQNIQHLLIGNRGCGKTHLIRVLYNRLSINPDVTRKTIIAYMAEEEIGIDSFFSFLIRIIEALIRWSDSTQEIADWRDKINTLKEIQPQDREETAKNFLISYLGEKKLLILAENIDEIFEGMKKTGQSKLRDFIQLYDKINFIATSQTLFADIQKEDKPFHNFFQIIHLKRLGEGETIELIRKLAETEGGEDIQNHLNTARGNAQIKTIHFLSGGNHRLIVLFFEFLKTDFKSVMSEPFLKTLDKLKPYYESFIRYLPPQQQKIVYFLALKHQPQLGSTIARECFLTPGGTSKQMHELQNKGFVDAYRIGRDSKYELAEPIMRFCIELTYNRDGIIGMFAKYINLLYSDAEIISRYLKLKYLSRNNCKDEKKSLKYREEVLIYEKASDIQNANIKYLESLIEEIDDVALRNALTKIIADKSGIYYSDSLVKENSASYLSMDKDNNNDIIWKMLMAELIKYSLFNEAYKLVEHSYNMPNFMIKENNTLPALLIKGMFSSGASKDKIGEISAKLLSLSLDDLSKKLITVLYKRYFENDKYAIYDLSKEERELLGFLESDNS